MNKIFRVVWSHAAQSWVAVSELTSAKGKAKSKTISKLAALSLVAGTALSMDAMAASSPITAVSKTDGNLAILTNNQASINAHSTGATTPKNVIYIGNGRVPGAIGDEFVAIGNDMTGSSAGNAGDTLIGNRVRSGGGGQDSFATAVGYAAQVSGPSVSIGVGTSSDIGSDRGWEAVKDSGVAIGAFSRVSGSANGGVAMGAISFADQTGSVAIGQLSGAASLIYDREVKNPGNGGVVYGGINESTGGNLVSIGAEAGARSTSSVAIGTQSTTSLGNDSIAMGTNSAAIKNNSIAIGHAAIAGGHTQADINALKKKKESIEKHKVNADKRLLDKTAAAAAEPTAENKFQLSAAKAAVERLDLAIRRIDADLQRLSSVTTRNATNAIAIGNQAKATDESALAFGDTANATGKASIAQGKNTQATAENAIAVGTSSNVSGANSVALGANITKLTTDNSVVLGANSTEVVGTTGASHEVKTVNDATVRTIAGPNFTYSGFVGKPADAGHYVSIGQAGKERQIKNLAAGAVTPTSTDAINGSQLYALMDRVENKQEPVVYTNKDGNKLVKVGDKFYKTTDLDDKGQPKTGVQSVADGDVIASMNNAGNNTTTPMALANIAGNLPGANGSDSPVASGELPTGDKAPKTSNAATVGDVLNAGWNLTEKGVARDFVKPYDTVDFIDGNGTSVTVTTDAGNKVSHIKYDVKAADDSITVGNGGIKVNTGGITPVTKDDGDKKSGQVIPNKGDENKVASVGDVANAINSAFWKVTGAKDGGEFAEGNATTEEAVKAGDKVTFKAGENIKLKQAGKDFTYSLNPVLSNITSIGGNGTTMTFKPEGVDLGGKKITNIAPGTDGTDAVNKSQLDAAVNGMATKPLSFSGDNKEAGKFDRTLGTEVKVVGGADASKLSDNNIGVIGDKTDTLTVKLAKSLKGLSDVEVKDDAGNTTNITPNGITISQPAKDGKKPDNVSLTKDGLNNGGQNITNVAGNLPGAKKDTTAPTTSSEGPSATDLPNITNNAATVGDVLNAGWNLQNNGEAKDFVKPYDTVNFVDGKGTKAVVETTPNGTTSNVKFDVDTGTVTSNKDGSVSGPVTPEMQKALDDAKKALADATTPKAKKAAQDKVDAAQANINNAGNQIATAQGVADAINKSGFTLATSANGGEKISGTPEMINPGKKVEMVAGKNMTVKQESNGKVTYATASNVTFDSVQFGDNGPKITNNGGNINVGTATGAPTKITGVAPGEISSTSTDAINGSQLHSVASDINNRIGSLDNKIDMADKNLRGGVAQAIAAAGLVQAYLPGKSLLAIGGGVYRGEAGYAIGYSSISDNGNWIIKGTASGNSRGHFGASTSVGYQW